MTFSNNQLSVHELPQLDSINFHPISRRYLRIICINYINTWTVLISVFSIISYNSKDLSFGLTTIIISLITLFFAILTAISILAFKKRGYAIRELDISYKTGLLGFNTTVIPYKHIQHVTIRESWLARIFKLVTLEMYTSGAGKVMVINGLEIDEAHKLQSFLLNKISKPSKTI